MDSVTNLWEMLAKHHEKLSPDFELAVDSKKKWAKYLRKKFSEISTKLIVADEEGDIVGFMLCLLSPNVPVYKEKNIGAVSDVYVLEERRRKGVAKEMLNFAVKWFKKNRVRTIQLSVAHDNPEAKEVWRQIGFKPFIIHERLDVGEYSSPTLSKARKLLRKRKTDKK